MATYTELHSLRGSDTVSTLKQKTSIAICIKANTISKSATPTDAQKAFALAALQSPDAYLMPVLNFILAEFNTSTLATITGATDAQVQTAVNSAVDTLLGV